MGGYFFLQTDCSYRAKRFKVYGSKVGSVCPLNAPLYCGTDILVCVCGVLSSFRDFVIKIFGNRSQWIDIKEQNTLSFLHTQESLLCPWRPKGRVRTPEGEIPAGVYPVLDTGQE
ncbi:hypothetical protein HY792_02550 [Candidatus Desantisbacteria bacterium]|nr:hypothetical protein [Candidatus Desantisbacteria bacterium]